MAWLKMHESITCFTTTPSYSYGASKFSLKEALPKVKQIEVQICDRSVIQPFKGIENKRWPVCERSEEASGGYRSDDRENGWTSEEPDEGIP